MEPVGQALWAGKEEGRTPEEGTGEASFGRQSCSAARFRETLRVQHRVDTHSAAPPGPAPGRRRPCELLRNIHPHQQL